MKTELSRFLISLFIFSAIAAAGIIAWNKYMPELYHSPYMLWELLYFVASTLFTHYLLMAAAKKSNQHFIRSFMALTALRLFVNLIIVLIFGIFNRADAVPFILGFLVLYFAYAVFELVWLRKQLRS